jgi:hypothetical protein
MLRKLEAEGNVAPEVLALDLYRRLRFGALRLSIPCLALSRAWDNRDNDPLTWVEAVRQARQALE